MGRSDQIKQKTKIPIIDKKQIVRKNCHPSKVLNFRLLWCPPVNPFTMLRRYGAIRPDQTTLAMTRMEEKHSANKNVPPLPINSRLLWCPPFSHLQSWDGMGAIRPDHRKEKTEMPIMENENQIVRQKLPPSKVLNFRLLWCPHPLPPFTMLRKRGATRPDQKARGVHMSNFVLGGWGGVWTRNLKLVLLRVDRPNIKNEIRTIRGLRPHVECHSHTHT